MSNIGYLVESPENDLDVNIVTESAIEGALNELGAVQTNTHARKKFVAKTLKAYKSLK